MLGMMNNKGGQNGVQGQQPPIANLAAMFGSNQAMAPQGQAPQQPGMGVQVPQIAAPQRPVLAPPPRIPMPQPVAQTPAKPSFRDMFLQAIINEQTGRNRRRGER